MQAPLFELQAVGSERIVGNPHSLPKTLVLLFSDHSTVEASRELNQQIRGEHKDSEDVLVASVLDMSNVPRFMKKMVQSAMSRAYSDAAKEVPEGYDPSDFIVLLPDYSGDVFRAFEVGELNKKALLIIVDHEGKIAFRKQGGNLGRAALRELEKLI